MSQASKAVPSLYHNADHELQTQACIPALQYLQDTTKEKGKK
jgi:hypothetical protein